MKRKEVLKVNVNERAGNPRLKPFRPRSVARLRCQLKAAERSPYIAWFIAAAHGLGALCMVEKGTSPMGDQDSPSAFASIRALRDDLRARLDQNEDFRAWRALDQALRELDPPTLPKAVEMVLTGTGTRPDDNVAFSFGRRS